MTNRTSALRFASFLSFYIIGISFRRGRSKRQRNFMPKPKKLHRTNEEIRAKEVRVLDVDEESLGVFPIAEALQMAKEKGVDLIEISSKASPPVCRLLDYGKMIYAFKKKEQKKKLANKPLEMKGIRLTFRMGEGDSNRQLEKAKEFLSDGHPIKIQLLMKGREKAHKDLAIEKIKTFIESLAEVGQPDSSPKVSNHQILSIVKPSKSQTPS